MDHFHAPEAPAKKSHPRRQQPADTTLKDQLDDLYHLEQRETRDVTVVVRFRRPDPRARKEKSLCARVHRQGEEDHVCLLPVSNDPSHHDKLHREEIKGISSGDIKDDALESISKNFNVNSLKGTSVNSLKNMNVKSLKSMNVNSLKNANSKKKGRENIIIKRFKFDTVLDPQYPTEAVFAQVGEPAVSEVVRGISSVILAYGATGSGKTYTLLGSIGSPDPKHNVSASSSTGLVTMMFQSLHNKLEKLAKAEKNQYTYTMEVSAVQIYMDHVYDILSADGSDPQGIRVQTRILDASYSQSGGEVCEFVPSATCLPCNNVKDLEEKVMKIVNKRRAQGAHLINQNSSRSHLIITIAVKRSSNRQGGPVVSLNRQDSNLGQDKMLMSKIFSKLLLVDLAGSERDSARKENEVDAQGNAQQANCGQTTEKSQKMQKKQKAEIEKGQNVDKALNTEKAMEADMVPQAETGKPHATHSKQQQNRKALRLEAISVNRSLSVLRACLRSLSKKPTEVKVKKSNNSDNNNNNNNNNNNTEVNEGSQNKDSLSTRHVVDKNETKDDSLPTQHVVENKELAEGHASKLVESELTDPQLDQEEESTRKAAQFTQNEELNNLLDAPNDTEKSQASLSANQHQNQLQDRKLVRKQVFAAGLHRSSTLTRILKEYFTGSKIFFLACCSKLASSSADTHDTLQYGHMVRHFKTEAEGNAILQDQGSSGYLMEMLPCTDLISHKKILRSSKQLTVPLNEIRAHAVRIMVSHKWLSPDVQQPDDTENHKHALLCELFQRLAWYGWIHASDQVQLVNVVVWMDYGKQDRHFT
jgi:hypothetical protein